VEEVSFSRASTPVRVPCLTSWNIKRKVWTEVGSIQLFIVALCVLFKLDRLITFSLFKICIICLGIKIS